MEKVKAQFMKVPKEGLFLGYVKQRIKHNKNFLGAITGPTGSGKTYSSLKIAEVLDKDFSAQRVVFTPKEFIDVINNGKLKSGSVIVFDEAGVSLNNRQWQSLANQVIQFVLQTFRHKNYIVIFTAPDFGFIDIASRKLFHSYMETKGINFQKKVCYLKPFMIQINQRSGDMYFKYLQAIVANKGETKIESMAVGLPSKRLIEEYEIKKTEFTKTLNQDIESKLNEEKQKKNKHKTPDEKQLEIIERMKDNKKSWRDIGEVFGNTPEGIRKWYSRNKKDGLNTEVH